MRVSPRDIHMGMSTTQTHAAPTRHAPRQPGSRRRAYKKREPGNENIMV